MLANIHWRMASEPGRSGCELRLVIMDVLRMLFPDAKVTEDT